MKIEIELDPGQAVTQAVEKIEDLEKCLTLATTSREFNRKRVVELEDELDRYRRAHVCTSGCRENAHVAFEGKDLVKELEREKADETERADRAEDTLIRTRKSREETEAQRDRLIQEANAREALHAQVAADQIRSIQARDQLLTVATTRVRMAQEILSRPGVVGARNDIVTSKGAILADAIGNALDVLSA